MNKKEKIIESINKILKLIKNAYVLTANEKKFLELYKNNIEIFKSRIIKDEIDISGVKERTGLFKWIGEYDNLVENNQDLYNTVYEMEEIFINS